MILEEVAVSLKRYPDMKLDRRWRGSDNSNFTCCDSYRIALRDDFVTVGLLLLESDGGFAEVRFTRDWRMLQCVAPDVELEWFEMVESEIRESWGVCGGAKI